jgi:addiction module RelB/DinJ family antitoxin
MTKAIQIRIDTKLKKDAENVLEHLGMDVPTAVRIFLKKVVVSRSIPFELKHQKLTVNGFTEEFENEVLEAEKEDQYIGPFKTAKEAIKALHQKNHKWKSSSKKDS